MEGMQVPLLAIMVSDIKDLLRFVVFFSNKYGSLKYLYVLDEKSTFFCFERNLVYSKIVFVLSATYTIRENLDIIYYDFNKDRISLNRRGRYQRIALFRLYEHKIGANSNIGSINGITPTNDASRNLLPNSFVHYVYTNFLDDLIDYAFLSRDVIFLEHADRATIMLTGVASFFATQREPILTILKYEMSNSKHTTVDSSNTNMPIGDAKFFVLKGGSWKATKMLSTRALRYVPIIRIRGITINQNVMPIKTC